MQLEAMPVNTESPLIFLYPMTSSSSKLLAFLTERVITPFTKYLASELQKKHLLCQYLLMITHYWLDIVVGYHYGFSDQLVGDFSDNSTFPFGYSSSQLFPQLSKV